MHFIDKQRFIFGSLFLISNRLQVIGDQYLGQEGMTTKQWFLTVILSQFQQAPPTLSEVAELMGSSRQNVKQLALKLQDKGFLRIYKDAQDARAMRLELTDRSKDFWEKRQEQDELFIKNLFQDITEQDLDTLYNAFQKLLNRIDTMKPV